MVYTVVNTGNRDEDDADSRPAKAKTKSDGFWNIDLELRALKTILTPSSDWATKVYAVCKPEFFHQSTTKAIFVHLQSLLTSSNTFELPTLDFILSDSKLSPAIREAVTAALSGTSVVIVNSQGDFDILVQGLSSLSKTRALYKAAHTATNELLDSDNPDQLRKQVTARLGQSLFAAESDDELLAQISMGKPYNQAAEDAFNLIINGSFEKVKIKTGFKEFDNKTGGFHRTNLVVFGANSGGGKCCHFDTLIPTTQGLFKIGNLYNLFAKPDDKGWIPVPAGTLQVYTREGIKDVAGVFKTEGTTYKIETNWGDEFEGLGEHKLYCYDCSSQAFGFKRLDEIQVGIDWILKKVGTNLYGDTLALPYTPLLPKCKSNQRFEDVTKYPTELTPDLAILFGLIVSEGSKEESICNNDMSLLEYVQNVIQTHFGCFRKITPNRMPRHYIRFGTYLSHYFTSFTGHIKSGDRFVPICIMRAPENIQCAFLRGLYEGDGSIHELGKTKRGKNTWALQYTTISRRLALEIKALLENMGIYCVIYSVPTEKTTTYYLHVCKKSYITFQQKIGFLSERKNSELARCIEHRIKMNACTSSQDTNHLCSGHYNKIPKQPIIDYINRVFDLMSKQTIEIKRTNMLSYTRPLGKYHALFSCHGSVQNVLNPRTKFTSTYTANLIVTSHHRWSGVHKSKHIPVLSSIRDLIENDAILKKLRSHINKICSHIWAQVKSVEKKNEVVPVFDLSVLGPHEYAANGLMSHNSLFAVNLLERQYRLGYNVVLVSYEMTDQEVLIRLLSNIGEVDMNQLQNNKLTPPEINRVTSAWREFNLEGYERTNGYHIICPKSETTVPEIGFRVRNLKPDVLILDYINLLGSSMGSAEAQWQKLGDISREAKILANKLNCVVILLAQIDDAYNLRYSKAIKDHANFVMAWIRDDTSKTSHIINIKQIKARNAPLYDFPLGEKFEWGQFRDPDQEDRTTWPNADELMMLELRCQSLGLKPEPTVSKEYDAKIRSEAKRLVNTNMEDVAPKKDEGKEVKQPTPESTSLLYSAEDLPVDFSKLVVKESALSWPMDNTLYEDTV